MKFEREDWAPLTVTFETEQEAEALHRILALVVDNTTERVGLFDLFEKLGRGLDPKATVTASGVITLKDKKD